MDRGTVIGILIIIAMAGAVAAFGMNTMYQKGYADGQHAACSPGNCHEWLTTARELDRMCNDSCCLFQFNGTSNSTPLVIQGGRI